MVENTVQAVIHVGAPVRQTWSVLTDPAFLGTWFGNGRPAELELRPGGILNFGRHTTHGALLARIDQVSEPSLLAFRWSQGEAGEEPSPGNSTLVQLRLTDHEGGTRVTFEESGFAELPELDQEYLARRHDQNAEGIPAKLCELRDAAEQAWVPDSEQHSQGGRVSGFNRSNRVLNEDSFRVAP